MTDSKYPVRVKFCGMTRPQDAALASELGADAIGMIFYAKSARNISLQQARAVAAAVNPLCGIVAVVVNPEVAEVERILEAVPISMLQFHGDESAEFCSQFQRPYMKAVRMKQGTDLAQIQHRYANARALLLDTYDKNLVGGTGRPFDWSMLGADPVAQSGPSIILAGGLAPDNVMEAVRRTGIRNLDVNSGVEIEPGLKDPQKMREVMRNLSTLGGKSI